MKILVAGDFCPQHRVAESFEKEDFAAVLGEVKPVIEQADYSIVNFECPIIKGGETPIKKCGPNLHCSEKGMEAVKWAGFNCVTLANNHFLDYGEEGVKNTLDTAKKYGIDTVGGGNNLKEASRILYKEINGQTLAIINCCEHEFSIATDDTAGSNPLNPIQQYYAIQEAKSNADYVLVIVHGGHEMWQLPSPRMQEAYRFFVDAGADAVVNHHQHCYSGYETYKDKPIFYGLGNFCFDKNKKMIDIWYEGYLAVIDFCRTVSFTIFPYLQCKNSPCVKRILDFSYERTQLRLFNQIILDKEKLDAETSLYYNESAQITRLAFEPYRGRVLGKLYRMGLLPSFFNKKSLKIRNMIECESHREKIIRSLQ